LRNRLIDIKRRQELLIQFTKSNYDYYMDIIRPGGLSSGLFDFESRLQNQPGLRKLLKIEEKSDINIMSLEYAHFIKSWSEGSIINDLNNILTDIDTIVGFINTEMTN